MKRSLRAIDALFASRDRRRNRTKSPRNTIQKGGRVLCKSRQCCPVPAEHAYADKFRKAVRGGRCGTHASACVDQPKRYEPGGQAMAMGMAMTRGLQSDTRTVPEHKSLLSEEQLKTPHRVARSASRVANSRNNCELTNTRKSARLRIKKLLSVRKERMHVAQDMDLVTPKRPASCQAMPSRRTSGSKRKLERAPMEDATNLITPKRVGFSFVFMLSSSLTLREVDLARGRHA